MKVSGWLRVVRCASLLLLPLSACGGATGSGTDGTEAPGTAGCRYAGMTYKVDEVFPAEDGCNLCRCTETLEVACGHVPCQVCRDLEAQHAMELEQAKVCDPLQPNQCTRRVRADLLSDCTTFGTMPVSSVANGDFIYTDLGCTLSGNSAVGPISCGIPVSGSCSADGKCVDSFVPGAGAACRFGSGTTYPSGSMDVPDPLGCAECFCSDGQVFCYTIGCEDACPEGTALGRRCAECGPSGECRVVERDCYLECTGERCDASPCVDGLCVDSCL